MALARARPVVVAHLLVLLAIVAVVAAQRPAGAASSTTVVSATVPSAISLTDGCIANSGRSLGTVLPGSNGLTAAGAGVCRYTFSSTNASSMLRLYQSDRAGSAMVGMPTAWTLHQNAGAPLRLAEAGTGLMVAQYEWGLGGTYLRSTDGGQTWSPFSPGDGLIQSISAPSTTVAWRAASGWIRRSTNMQNATPTWTTINANVQGGGTVQVADIDAVNANVAWAVNGGTAYRTGDGGATNWSSSWTGCSGAARIDVASSSTAYTTGWGNICRSNDSNLNWYQINTGVPAGFWATNVEASPVTISTVYAVGGGGVVVRSTNSGTNWAAVGALPTPVDLQEIEVLSDSEVWVAGRDGMVFRSIDSGATWARIRVPISGNVTSLSVASASSYAVTSEGSAVAATYDGGTTWVRADPSVTSDALHDIDATDAKTLVASESWGRVRWSSDGWATSQLRTVWPDTRNVRGVAMVDDDSWIVVGDQGSIALTDDAGATWTNRTSGVAVDLWDVDVTTEGVVIAVGANGTILRSSDWGWSWTTRATGGQDLRRVAVRSGAPMIATGFNGTIRRSTDQGVTWTSPASGMAGYMIDSVSIASDQVIYVAADQLMGKSTDGGATWTTRAIGGMGRVAAISENTIVLTTGYIGGWSQWINYSFDGGATFTSPMANQEPDVTSLVAVDGGRIFFGGHSERMRSTDPPAAVADYAGGAWAGGSTMFGACLQDFGGLATVASWAEDTTGGCTATDADPWNAVPTAPVKVAQLAAPGTGSVDIVWGMRVATNQAAGVYNAGIAIEAVAPNA